MKTKKEFRDYEGDVLFAIWKNGGNPDLVEYEDIYESFSDDMDVDDAMRRELKKQQDKNEPARTAFFRNTFI